MKQSYYSHLFTSFLSLTIIMCLFSQSQVKAQDTDRGSAGFLLKDGKDTITIERFTRGKNLVEGRVMVKKQIPIVYKIATAKENKIDRLTLQVLKPGMPEGTPPQQEAILNFKGDSIQINTLKGGTTEREAIKTTENALAYHPQLPMISLLEQIIMRARTLGDKEVTVPVFLLSSKGQTVDSKISFTGEDSARFEMGNIVAQLKVNKNGEILGGKTSSGQIISRLETVPDAAFATQAPDYSAPPGAPYTSEEVRIKTKAGHVLVGTLTLPKNTTKKVPVVVTITGSSPQDRDHNTPFGGPYRPFYQLADELGKKGIAVLRMDDRGVGKSTGSFENATTQERADDIREGIRFVQSHQAIDKNNVVLVGLSEGAMIAPIIAQTNKNLSGIVLMAGPASTGEEILKYQVEGSIERSKDVSPDKKEKLMKQAMEDERKEAENSPWLRYFLDYDPLKTARQVKNVPVLILQGTSDKNVPPGDAEKLEKAFKQAGNKDVTRKMFENYNHIFLQDPDGDPKKYQDLKSFKLGPEVLQPIVDWVAMHTKSTK